jgi:CheY-like chemotaxis protein
VLLTGKRIFCIEDDNKNRAITQMILEREGAVIGFERWGRGELLAKLDAFMPVDLILLDLMLPHGVTGYDVFDAIRSNPAFEAIPIAALSASDPALEVPKTQARGFAGFISKPVSMTTFPQQVVALLSGERIWA